MTAEPSKADEQSAVIADSCAPTAASSDSHGRRGETRPFLPEGSDFPREVGPVMTGQDLRWLRERATSRDGMGGGGAHSGGPSPGLPPGEQGLPCPACQVGRPPEGPEAHRAVL